MAAKKASGPTCKCGEVVFDLTDKKSGAILRCPWCHQRYRLEEGGTVTPLANEKGDASSRAAKVEKPSTRSRMRPASRTEPVNRADDDASDEEDDSQHSAKPGKPSTRSRMRTASRSEPTASPDADAVDEEDDCIEEEVEVFRFDSEDPDEKRSVGKKDRFASKPRSERSRGMAEDPTERLEWVSRRRVQDEDPENGRRGEPVARSRSSRPRVASGDPTEALNRISRRTRREAPLLDENGQPLDELPPVKPLDLEKWVFRTALGMVPVGTLLFMAWVIYGVYSGQRDFVTHKVFGLTIRGDNPWVWFAGVVMGGLAFLGIWVGYVYFFVHKKKLAEMEKKRRKEQERTGSASGRRSTRRLDEDGKE